MDNEARLRKLQNIKAVKPIDTMSSLEQFVNNSIIVNKYSRSWNKLEKKLKITKLKQFCDDSQKNYNFNNDLKNKLFQKLLSLLNCSNLNKKNQITYDENECIITEIKGLSFGNEIYNFKL